MGASQRVAIRWIEAANVQVVIDRDKTLDARKKWPMFNEVIVGRFDSSLALYRVFDETELKHVVSTGKITGGSYSVRPERAYGASWGHDITHVVNLGNHLRGGRLGNQIYLAKIDGFDYEFSHLGPGFDVDPAGPEEQTVTMTANKCNPGLGCSILVKTVDVDAFFKVDPSGQIHSMSQSDMKKEVQGLTSQKVAAEVLTKEWLSGVRRGWLKLMAPQITDYDDVMKAFKNLEAFVENLNDQVRYVRRAPIISIPTLSESQAFSKEVRKLEDTLDNAWSKARYWKEYIDGTAHSLKWGEDRTPDALKMLDLYKRNFDEATSGSVAIKGGGGHHRPQSLTELMDRILKILRLEAQRLKTTLEIAPESESDYTPVYKEFDLHGMKVVLNDKTISARYVQMYIKLIDHAYELLKSKGFGKVWYGTLLIECEQCGGENQYGAELGVGGHYRIGPNTVHIFSRPDKDIIHMIIHELGHRWWFKHMTSANRLQFEDWIVGGLVPVSVYGGKHHHEAFAEAFSWYVRERPMTAEQVETFKLVALGKLKTASVVALRYQAQ